MKQAKATIQQPKPEQYYASEDTKAAVRAIINNPIKINSGTKRVVLDAGHGGTDCGAVSGRFYEKDVNLDVTNRVRDILVKQGYSVILTRPDDKFVSLQDRVTISENNNPDIFVSIHVNSSTNSGVSGIETHYYHQESMELAQKVHAALASKISSPNRGLFKSKFYDINHTTVPAILVEIGFISNEEERTELFNYTRRQATATAIADGIQS